MKEKCGCEVTVDPKTQFETVRPCKKHDTWGRFLRGMRSYLKSKKKK